MAEGGRRQHGSHALGLAHHAPPQAPAIARREAGGQAARLDGSHQLYGFRRVRRAQVVFRSELHELPVGFLGQRPRYRCKTFEQRVGLPEQPLAVCVQPLGVAAVR